jgi:hypothetical protein
MNKRLRFLAIATFVMVSRATLPTLAQNPPNSADRQKAEREHKAILDAISGKTDADWKLGETLERDNKRVREEKLSRPEVLPRDFSVTEPRERDRP